MASIFDELFGDMEMGVGVSASSGHAFEIRLDGAIAEHVREHAKISGETVTVVVKRALSRLIAVDLPRPLTAAEWKKIASKVRKSDAGDDWQDYVDWPE